MLFLSRKTLITYDQARIQIAWDQAPQWGIVGNKFGKQVKKSRKQARDWGVEEGDEEGRPPPYLGPSLANFVFVSVPQIYSPVSPTKEFSPRLEFRGYTGYAQCCLLKQKRTNITCVKYFFRVTGMLHVQHASSLGLKDPYHMCGALGRRQEGCIT